MEHPNSVPSCHSQAECATPVKPPSMPHAGGGDADRRGRREEHEKSKRLGGAGWRRRLKRSGPKEARVQQPVSLGTAGAEESESLHSTTCPGDAGPACKKTTARVHASEAKPSAWIGSKLLACMASSCSVSHSPPPPHEKMSE
jgi:hypothetical protein